MDYINLIISAISMIVSVITLIIVFKNMKLGDLSLGNDDLKKIKDSVNESVNILGVSISNLVAEKNKSLMEKINNDISNLTKDMNDLMNKQDNYNKSQHDFKIDVNNLLNLQKESLLKIINDFINRYTNDSNKQKDEIMTKLSSEMKEFNEEIEKVLDKFSSSVKEKLDDFKNNTNDSIKELKITVNDSLEGIRKDNKEKLDEINSSVNEKLQKTLEDKLQSSFKSVVEGIGDVNKAVGEIKGLATDVGSLKNVLTNVKTKGILGEVILGNIIRDFLTSNQYEENVATKKGSRERVEFAIKLPGKGDDTIYLPVDSKFPYESYSTIRESSDVEEIKNAKTIFKNNLIKYAKDVSEKYIDVPNTTDFAVIFLPLEGLYLEALNMGLFEELQSKYKINLTGPTTFTAFINSLNMGFRSLMIEKKSADVFKLLGAVKAEFNKFADSLEKTQKKFNQASDELDNLVGTRTRQMNLKLKNIDALDDETAKFLIDNFENDE